MTEKIRLYAQGVLREDLHANLGKGMDSWITDFLRVSYEDVKAQALAGVPDGELLAWCQQTGRQLSETDKMVWRTFILNYGHNDRATETLIRRKAESGLSHRDDIRTIAHYIDVDEGRDQPPST